MNAPELDQERGQPARSVPILPEPTENSDEPFSAAPALPPRSLILRASLGLWKWAFGALLSTFLLFGFIVVGWTARAARREVLRTWWRRSPVRFRSPSFRCFSLSHPSTADQAAWPSWILGARPSDSHQIRSLGRRVLGGLGRNAGLGVQMAFNTAVLTLPGCMLWSVAWFAGWQNSFNKGYEHAWFGPSIFILGMLLFTAAMAYVPLAQARQASTHDWRRFYDFCLVGRLIRRHWLASVGLALIWAGASGLVLLIKLLPAVAQYVPQLTDLTPAEALPVSRRFFVVVALGLFPLYVALRLLAARVYANALCSAFQAGVITEEDLGEVEWHALRRLEMLTPRPAAPRQWFVQLARWLATRTGQITAGTTVLAVWFGFSFLVIVSEFFNKTEFGRGWWNQPMIQLPWFDYTPNRLREAARQTPDSEASVLLLPSRPANPSNPADP